MGPEIAKVVLSYLKEDMVKMQPALRVKLSITA